MRGWGRGRCLYVKCIRVLCIQVLRIGKAIDSFASLWVFILLFYSNHKFENSLNSLCAHTESMDM